MGVDCLNPVQINAQDMDPAELKREYGRDLVFWGGIDTQALREEQDEKKVAAEVKRVSDILGEGGGYVLAPIHNIQANIPPHIIVAMYTS